MPHNNVTKMLKSRKKYMIFYCAKPTCIYLYTRFPLIVFFREEIALGRKTAISEKSVYMDECSEHRRLLESL